MLLGLNGATTMKADLATDIRVAGEAGYDVVEIWAAKLDRFLDEGSLVDVYDLLTAAGVRAHAINSIERISFRNRAGWEEVQDRCEQLSEYAEALHCPWIVVVPSPLPEGVGREEVHEETVRVLRHLAAIAAGYDVGLALEPLGFEWCSVRTLADGWAIVQAVDRPNPSAPISLPAAESGSGHRVGINIDAFHFTVGGSRIETIAQVDPARLAIFHINDAEDRPFSEMTDAHRLFPGLGILPLRDIIAALKSIGYDGVCSVEIFRPEYWEWDPLRVAREAKRVIEALI